MKATLSMFIPLEYKQFDAALEAVMLKEEQATKRLTLADHPVYGMLVDSVDQLTTPNAYGVKMTTPVDHTPEVTIVTRVKAIGGFFNPELTAEQWQAAVDHHPASAAIAAELQEALNNGTMNGLMDRLDATGFETTFNKTTWLFTIMFKEAADINIADTQRDLKNKRLLDDINGVDPMHNPTGGWHDDKPVFTRSHPWKLQLKDPNAPEAYRFKFRDVIVAPPTFPRRSD